jgi:ApaG protein
VNDRQPRVPGEAHVGTRALAEHELAAALAGDEAQEPAGGAEPARNIRLPAVAAIVHHDEVFTSEALTRGIRIAVVSEYSPEQSAPSRQLWRFLYTITISNEGPDTVRLVSRHWIITDGNGTVEEVRGEGVVGQQPVLNTGESFTYTSGCELKTPFGLMEGTYQMVSETGASFDVRIAPFTLSEPYTVH